jgi:ribosome-binding protein aMBF1 (putative translation factor)
MHVANRDQDRRGRTRNKRPQPTQTSTEHQRLLRVMYRYGDRVSGAVCDRRWREFELSTAVHESKHIE